MKIGAHQKQPEEDRSKKIGPDINCVAQEADICIDKVRSPVSLCSLKILRNDLGYENEAFLDIL